MKVTVHEYAVAPCKACNESGISGSINFNSDSGLPITEESLKYLQGVCLACKGTGQSTIICQVRVFEGEYPDDKTLNEELKSYH